MTMRSPLARLLVLFIFSAFGTAAHAQHMNAPGSPCNRPSTTPEEYGCFAKASVTADRALNALYTKVRTVLSPEESRDLLEAQRAWIKYRDLTCNAEYKLYGGGTGGPVTQQACLLAITEERITTLKTTYEWRLDK